MTNHGSNAIQITGIVVQRGKGQIVWCKGKVQGNVIILEEGVHLPDGLDVMVMTEHTAEMVEGEVSSAALARRRALVAQMQAFGQRLAGRSVHLSDALLESREELEARA